MDHSCGSSQRSMYEHMLLNNLFLCFNFVFSFNVIDVEAGEVDLTVFAPHTNNSVMLCPDHNFFLVFECVVRNSNWITWRFSPFIKSDGMFYNIHDQLQENPIIRRGNDIITLFFITHNTETISLLKVCTNEVINEIGDCDIELSVTCSAEGNVNETMTIGISGKELLMLTLPCT